MVLCFEVIHGLFSSCQRHLHMLSLWLHWTSSSQFRLWLQFPDCKWGISIQYLFIYLPTLSFIVRIVVRIVVHYKNCSIHKSTNLNNVNKTIKLLFSINVKVLFPILTPIKNKTRLWSFVTHNQTHQPSANHDFLWYHWTLTWDLSYSCFLCEVERSFLAKTFYNKLNPK